MSCSTSTGGCPVKHDANSQAGASTMPCSGQAAAVWHLQQPGQLDEEAAGRGAGGVALVNSVLQAHCLAVLCKSKGPARGTVVLRAHSSRGSHTSSSLPVGWCAAACPMGSLGRKQATGPAGAAARCAWQTGRGQADLIEWRANKQWTLPLNALKICAAALDHSRP